MSSLNQTRCHHHGNREAAARCPSCQRFFCRECITEHDDRVICQACLVSLLQPEEAKGSHPLFRFAGLTLFALTGVTLTWVAFNFFGSILLSLPDSFH